MQVCTSLQTDNHASAPTLSFFTGRMPFLPPNQQHQSTEGPTIWNSLPDNVMSVPSLSTFRQRLKTFLFEASFPDIIIDPR